MTVEELDNLISITCLRGVGTSAKKYNSFYRIAYGNCEVKDIEIDWENREVIVWIEGKDFKIV